MGGPVEPLCNQKSITLLHLRAISVQAEVDMLHPSMLLSQANTSYVV